MKYVMTTFAATTLAANAATVISLYDAGTGASADDPRNQGWIFREVTAIGSDSSGDGIIDNSVTQGNANHGPVITEGGPNAGVGENAWQLRDRNGGGSYNLPQFAYQLDADTTTSMNDNGFTLTVAIENVGSGGGVWFGVRDPQENAGASGMFGRTASSRTAFTSGASNDDSIHTLTLTWDPHAGTMTRAIDGGVGVATTWGGSTSSNYIGSVDGGSQLLIDSGSGTPVTAGWNLVSAELSIVPEPSSAALIGLGGLALILRRRK